MVEKALRSERRLAPPQFHGIPGRRVTIDFGQCDDRRCECPALSEHELRRVGSGTVEQHQLQEEFGSEVSQVVDGTCQPTLGRRSAASGDPEFGPAAGIGPADQLGICESVERPVGEWPAERPDAPELAVGCEQLDDCPPVRRRLGDDGEACLIGERQR